MVDLLVRSVFLGFAIFVIAKGAASVFNSITLEHFTNRFHSCVRWAVGVTGILFWISILVGLTLEIISPDEGESWTQQIWSPHSFWLFIYIITYGIFSQLLWMEKFASSKWFNGIFTCLIMFALFFERLIVLTYWFHRDYVPSGWTTIRGVWWAAILDTLLYILVFMALIIVIYSVRNLKSLHIKKPFVILAVTCILFITVFKASYILLMMEANLPEYGNYNEADMPNVNDVVAMEFRNLTELMISIVTAVTFATSVLIIIGKKLKKGTIAGNTILLSLFLSSLYLLITMLAASGYGEDYFDVRWQETSDEVTLLLITFLLVAFPLAVYFKERIRVSQVLP